MEVLKVPYTEHEVDLINKVNRQPWYLSLNDRGSVPTVEFADGSIVRESRLLVESFDNQYENVLSKNISEKPESEIKAIFELANMATGPRFWTFFNLWRDPKTKQSDETEEAHIAFQESFVSLVRAYEHENSYFFGSTEQISLFDVLFYPLLFNIISIYSIFISADLFEELSGKYEEDTASIGRFQSYVSFVKEKQEFQRASSVLRESLPAEGSNVYLSENKIEKIEDFVWKDMFTVLMKRGFNL